MNNLPKEYYINPDNLKVGDKTYDVLMEEMEVYSINNYTDYPITCTPVNNKKHFISYTRTGRNHSNDKLPRLYSKNPFDLLNNRERVILVSMSGEDEDYKPRVLIKFIGDAPVVWQYAETIEEAKKERHSTMFHFWKELPEPKELTIEERVKEQGDKINEIFKALQDNGIFKD